MAADGRDLLLAADVLVTDYSSVLVDFALTGRPMVFFTPDLEHYRATWAGSTSTRRRCPALS